MTMEKRKHRRLSFEGKIFIERASADVHGRTAADLMLCKTVDISHSGIRAGIERELPMGAFLQVAVELAGEDHTLHLVGEVRWCIPSADSDDYWLVGFKLLDAEESDIETWRKYLAELDS